MTIATPPTDAPEAPGSQEHPRLAPWRRLILPVFLVLFVLGLVGVGIRLAFGHLPAGYGSYVPWGLWIAIYFHAIGIAAGALLITSVLHIKGTPGFRSPTAVRVAAVIVAASVGPGLLAVAMDLGHMTRAFNIVLDPSFTSMMALNSWMYFALLAVCAVAWWLTFRPDSGWLKPVLVLGAVLSTMIPAQSGAFFGVVTGNDFWHSALLPVLWLVGAVVAGSAVLMVVRAVLGDGGWGRVSDSADNALAAISVLRRIIIIALITYFVMEFAELSIELWNPFAKSTALELMLTGPYWWVFWIVHVLLAGIVPLVLLATRRPPLWVFAGLLLSVATISSRLNVLLPGQSVEDLEGLQDAFYHPRLSFIYEPTLMEYLVGMFCFALSIGLLYLGLRVTAAMAARTTTNDSRKELADVSDQ